LGGIHIIGCKNQKDFDARSMSTMATNDLLVLKDFATKSGLPLPSNAILLKTIKEDARDNSYNIREWTLFSPESFAMPKLDAPGVTNYLELPVKDSEEFIQSRIKSGKALNAVRALGSEWATNGFTFRATLLKASHGNYLLVERYEKK